MRTRYNYMTLTVFLAPLLAGCDAGDGTSAQNPGIQPQAPPGDPKKESADAVKDLQNAPAKVIEIKESDRPGAKWSKHTQGLPFVLGYQKGLARAKATGKPVMFFVTTTWCGWCKKLANESFKDSEIRTLLDKFVLVIVDGDKEGTAGRRLGASGFPHVVFSSSSGATLAVCRGYKPRNQFQSIVNRALEVAKSS